MTRKGIAIPLVLLFSTVLGVLATVIIKSSQQYGRQHQTSSTQLQAHFVARAGLQHALLKTKLLQRELYDAICLSQGRNPLFDFSQVKNLDSPGGAISRQNPGPIFLYKSGDGFAHNCLFTPGFNIGDDWLKAFLDDLQSAPPTADGITDINSVLNLAILPPPAGDIRRKMREPFAGQYSVQELSIAALNVTEDARVTNTAVVEVRVAASIRTARNEDWNHEIATTVRIQKN